MKGILRHDGDAWYVEYQEESSSSLSTGTPSKFALNAVNTERIATGYWLPEEGKMVSFDLTSLPLPPYYEVDITSRSSMLSPYHRTDNSTIPTPVIPHIKKMKTRYRYRVYFSGASRTIVADSMYQSSEVYYFYNHVKRGEPKYEYVDEYTTREVDYDKEVIAQFPILNTAIYEIEKFEEEDK